MLKSEVPRLVMSMLESKIRRVFKFNDTDKGSLRVMFSGVRKPLFSNMVPWTLVGIICYHSLQ